MSGTIKHENGHEYPDRYVPQGKDSDLDRAWGILDSINPGVIPIDVRSFLAGQITGLLMRTRAEEKENAKGLPKRVE